MRLIRKSIATLLIIHTLAVALAAPLIYLDFSLRRDYIAKVLCVNKTKPITICGGKCYLTSQLKKAESQSKEAATSSSQGADLSIFFAVNQLEPLTNAGILLPKSQVPYLADQSQAHLNQHSPPPQA